MKKIAALIGIIVLLMAFMGCGNISKANEPEGKKITEVVPKVEEKISTMQPTPDAIVIVTPTPLLTPTATPVPTVTPIIEPTVTSIPIPTITLTPTPTLESEPTQEIVVEVEPGEKGMIAITIDDGPTKYTDKFLDVIEEYNIHVTFFEIGSSIKYYEDEIKREIELGCQIGTHTYNHETLTKLSAEEISKTLEKGANAIYDVTGVYPTVSRFPGGGGSTKQKVLDAAGFPSIYWTIDTRDWESKNAEKVMGHIKKEKDMDGYIILIHSSHQTTLEAFKEMVPYLIGQGYELVTIDELAAAKGIALENGKNYITLK